MSREVASRVESLRLCHRSWRQSEAGRSSIQISLIVRSDGRYSSLPLGEDMQKDWVLRFRRALLVASDRLCLLEAIMSVMNFLQSTHTSMVAQSSVSSGGSSSSSWDFREPCLDNLRQTQEVALVSVISVHTTVFVAFKKTDQTYCIFNWSHNFFSFCSLKKKCIVFFASLQRLTHQHIQPLLTAFCKKPKSKSFVAPSIYMQRDNKQTPDGVYFRTHFQKSKSLICFQLMDLES